MDPLFEIGKALFHTSKYLVEEGKDLHKSYKANKEKREHQAYLKAIAEEKRTQRDALRKAKKEEEKTKIEHLRATIKKPTLLPEGIYSYQDLVNSDIHYADYLNAWKKLKEKITYVEPSINKFEGLINRQIGGDDNPEHITLLTNIYKIFMYNFSSEFPFNDGIFNLGTTIGLMEEQLSYTLSVASAKHELIMNGTDIFENNAAEKRARQLFREYFPDEFERVTDETYKTAIHCILTGEREKADVSTIKSVNLLEKYIYLLEYPDCRLRRGNGHSPQQAAKIAEAEKLALEAKKLALEAERRKQAERQEKVRQKKLAAEEAEKQRQLAEAEAEKQRQLAESEAAEQRKKERLLHADDDL